MMEEKQLYRIDQVSKRFNVSETTVNRWIASGKLEAIKLSRKLTRITEASIQKFLEDSKKETE